MEISQKIGVVDLMLGDSEKNRDFRAGWQVPDIQEALDDFILFEEDEEAERSDDDSSDEEEVSKPYLLIKEGLSYGGLEIIG